MDWILYLLLVLAAAGDILLAVVLAKVMRKNAGPEQKIDTADDFVRAVTPVLQSETDLLAEQLRAMQGRAPAPQAQRCATFPPCWPKISARAQPAALLGSRPSTALGQPASVRQTMPCLPS